MYYNRFSLCFRLTCAQIELRHSATLDEWMYRNRMRKKSIQTCCVQSFHFFSERPRRHRRCFSSARGANRKMDFRRLKWRQLAVVNKSQGSVEIIWISSFLYFGQRLERWHQERRRKRSHLSSTRKVTHCAAVFLFTIHDFGEIFRQSEKINFTVWRPLWGVKTCLFQGVLQHITWTLDVCAKVA